MSTYKITNITNHANKRDYKYNSVLDIEYVDNMTKKIISVKPNDTIWLTVRSLPLSVRKLRIKNLITVTEVSDHELANVISNNAMKRDVKIIEPETHEEAIQKQNKKKTIKKEVEELG